MIINQCDIEDILVIPTKNQSPWIVDPDAEEAIQIAFEGFQTVAWRHLQICQAERSVQDT